MRKASSNRKPASCPLRRRGHLAQEVPSMMLRCLRFMAHNRQGQIATAPAHLPPAAPFLRLLVRPTIQQEFAGAHVAEGAATSMLTAWEGEAYRRRSPIRASGPSPRRNPLRHSLPLANPARARTRPPACLLQVAMQRRRLLLVLRMRSSQSAMLHRQLNSSPLPISRALSWTASSALPPLPKAF